MAQTYTTPSGAVVDAQGNLISGPPQQQQIQQPQQQQQNPQSQSIPLGGGFGTPQQQHQQQPPQPQQQTQTTQQQQGTAPTTNLQPGAQGTDVNALQNYLVQQGYLTPQQISGGQGVYGPQTTAAVAKLQKDLGIQAGSSQGYYGPQTQAALQQKYQAYFQSVQKTQAPQNYPADQISALSSTSTDPVFGSMMSSMVPILQSLGQVMNNINNPALTGVSLQQEYNDLAQKMNIPQTQAQLLNYQNIMNGTEQDIRDEITKSGGFATDSQVLAMSAARNNVILKQYNALSTNYTAATTNLQNMMQYASTDQATELQKQQMQASVAESIAGIESQMASMGMTMQQNANGNLNKIVTNIGYTGLAAQAQGNPQILGYYESALGLARGTLSDPNALAQMETYRQQQLKLGQQRVTIQMYNAGMGGGYQGTNNYPITANPGGGSSITAPVSASDLVRPQGMPNNIPISLTQGQMQQYMKSNPAASIDPGTTNVVAPGIGYYLSQQDGSYVLKSAIPDAHVLQVAQQYNDMVNSVQRAQLSPVGGSPLNKGRLSRNANTALKSYLASPVYQNVSNGAVYLSRISAAMQNPGSISDLDLADSIIKINNGGGQVTEAQLNTYFQGQSFADRFAVAGDKLTSKGGVLSPDQRQDLQNLAQQVFNQYKNQYEQLYVQAGQNLEGQGIPINYLANMPDWTSFLTQ